MKLLQSRNSNNLLGTIFRGGLVSLDGPALDALVDDHGFAACGFNPDRLHQTLADVPAVAGIYIHVLAVKTFRAMVRIASALDLMSAMFADEIFFIPLKLFFGHLAKPQSCFTARISSAVAAGFLPWFR